jgi:hypothetical protein
VTPAGPVLLEELLLILARFVVVQSNFLRTNKNHGSFPHTRHMNFSFYFTLVTCMACSASIKFHLTELAYGFDATKVSDYLVD